MVTLGTRHLYDILSPMMRAESKTIVIAGAGFGGITAALTLERWLRQNPDWNIILIDRNPYQLYTPALYEIAAIPKEEVDPTGLKSIIAIPIADIIAGTRISFVRGEVTGLDSDTKTVYLNGGREIGFSFLVLALGSETNYFGIPGLREHALPLKRFEDAVRIRNKIERILTGQGELTLVVGGAGMSGIELVSELSNYVCYVAEKILNRPSCPVRFILVESSDTVLPGFDPRVSDRAAKRLAELGVEIRTRSRITAATPDGIRLNDTETIPCDMLVWTGGVVGNPVCDAGGLAVTDKKNCAVNEFLEVGNGVSAIGDAAGFIDPRTGEPLPWNIPVAEAEARAIATNIIREITGKPKLPFRPSRNYPYVLAIGRKYAIADLVVIRFWGFAGWCAKLLVELRYLLFVLPLPKAIRIWFKGIHAYTSND